MNRHSSHSAGRTDHIAAFITILIWGTTFISTKVLLRTFTPIEILFVRFLIGYLALWLVRPKRLAPAAERRMVLLPPRGCAESPYIICVKMWRYTFTLASNVGSSSLSPPSLPLFGCIFLKDKRPSPEVYLGFGRAIIGICLIGPSQVYPSLN